MNNTTKWKIELEISSELSINFNDGNASPDQRIISFNNIEATTEEMHQLIDLATKNEKVVDLRFPKNYKLLRYFIPYENLTSLSVSIETKNNNKKNTKLILNEVESILNNENKHNNK